MNNGLATKKRVTTIIFNGATLDGYQQVRWGRYDEAIKLTAGLRAYL